MRRIANPVAVGLVALVVLAAAADALRRTGAPADLAERLRGADVRGVLAYSDPDCGRHLVTLPAATTRTTARVLGCGLYARPGNLGVHRGEVVWYAFRGGTTRLLSRAELSASLGRPAVVRQVAWLGGMRYAAVYATAGRPGETLAVFERTRLVRVLGRSEEYADLRSSPTTRYLAAVEARGRLRVWDALGEPVALPGGVESGRALAWSPDDRFAAAALRDAVAIFRLGGDTVARLPVVAVDLDWRSA